MAVLAALGSATALAARPGLDRSFGAGGHAYLKPPLPPGYAEFAEERWVGAADGSVYVAAIAAPCRFCFDGPELLFRFRPDGTLDRSFGGRWHAVRLPLHQTRWHLGVDGRGRPVVTWAKKGNQVRRYTKTGHLDPSWGGDGVRWFAPLQGGAASVRPVGGGGLLLYIEGYGEHGFHPITFEKVREDGTPVRRFGGDGAATVDVPGEFSVEPVVTRDGSVLIGGVGCCFETISLTRVSARGRLDTRFDRQTRRSLRVLGTLPRSEEEHANLRAVLPLRGGRIALLGHRGRNGFEERLDPKGRQLPGFGRHGTLLIPRRVDAALPLGDDGEALATTERIPGHPGLYLLGADGRIDHRFGGADPILLPDGSNGAKATLAGPGVVDVTYGHAVDCQSCGRPFVARFDLPAGVGR